MQCLTATNAKWGNGGLVTFFNANSSQAGQLDSGDVPIAFRKDRHTRAALTPRSASSVWWSAWNFFRMQITRRYERRSTKQHRELRHISRKL